MDDSIRIYAIGHAGAVSGKDAIYAATLEWNQRYKEVTGVSENTTRNHANLLAVKEALESLKASGRTKAITIYTPSAYVANAINTNLKKWCKNNWRNSKKGLIKYLEDWYPIFNIIKINPMVKAVLVEPTQGCMANTLELLEVKKKEAILNGYDV